jgi:tRNA 2-thiocytidine biosynthesis protein TtcA
VEDYLKREGFPYEIVPTDYGPKAHHPDNKENPCFLCARMRRTALFKKAHELNCAKIAFGHNQDDFIETFLMNILYSAQVAGMAPKQPFFQGRLTIIRPMVLIPASRVAHLCRRLDLPVIPNPCPTAHETKRTEMRDLLLSLYRKNPKVRGNIFHAMSNVNLEYLPGSAHS